MEEKDIFIGRREILEQAALCVCQDRERQYSSPENSFAKIADLWSAYKPCDFTAHDVGIMMALLKIARISTGTCKEDSYVDLAGYAACAGEIALRGQKPVTENPATEEVEPWSKEDSRRSLEICKQFNIGECAGGACPFSNFARHGGKFACERRCEKSPAEARKIMDEWEGGK